MPIVLTRIDDRLIHGQVVEGWLKSIKVTRILVVSDEVARDKMQQALLGMAVPSTVAVAVHDVPGAAAAIREGAYAADDVLLLATNPADIVRLMDGGVAISSVNIGGMHYAHGKTQLLRNLSVDPADVDALYALHERGVELEGRILPGDDRIDVMEFVVRKFKRGSST